MRHWEWQCWLRLSSRWWGVFWKRTEPASTLPGDCTRLLSQKYRGLVYQQAMLECLDLVLLKQMSFGLSRNSSSLRLNITNWAYNFLLNFSTLSDKSTCCFFGRFWFESVVVGWTRRFQGWDCFFGETPFVVSTFGISTYSVSWDRLGHWSINQLPYIFASLLLLTSSYQPTRQYTPFWHRDTELANHSNMSLAIVLKTCQYRHPSPRPFTNHLPYSLTSYPRPQTDHIHPLTCLTIQKSADSYHQNYL